MSDPTVLELIVQKIDDLDKKVSDGFTRINGRLDRHDAEIRAVQVNGCAQYAAHRELLTEDPPSRGKRAARGGALVVAGGFVAEVVRRLVEAWK